MPVAQSSSVAQLVRHAVEPHTYGAHIVTAPALQAPDPLQPAWPVAVPLVQLAAPHDVVDPG